MQIKTARHAIKTDCGVDVAVAAVGSTCCDILDVVGDPASKSGNRVSRKMPVWFRGIRGHLLSFIIKQYSFILFHTRPISRTWKQQHNFFGE
jgi:hypothetical protein